ncbi:hypothetical protein [Stenotrophomonas nitritireducens]|uniref:hypothetical protein n=1 Tax=Stenotrophomonas nitritireducens TaxID=83617 RepID=UPI003D97ED9B
MRLFKGLAWLLLLVSAAWAFVDQSFEAVVAVIVALSGLVAAYLKDKKASNVTSGQHQQISGGSSGIQAGRNVNIRTGRGDDD